MQDFMRNKVIEVNHIAQDRLAVHGILDDSIYSLELDFEVRLPELEACEIKGRWLRWTTPECPRALDFLDEAEGFCLKEGIDNRIHKSIGRHACRHFANLFIECAYAVREAVKVMEFDAARRAQPELKMADFVAGREAGASSVAAEVVLSAAGPHTAGKASAGSAVTSRSDELRGRFVVDLHLHTSPASPCASDSVEAMIAEAKRIGLDGICLTDHNYVWSPDKVEALRKKHDFLVLAANEIVTEQGDMLVFGFAENIQGVIRLAELKERVAAVGGFIVAAHPFRGFLTFGADDVGLTPEKARERELFRLVDGVEVLNGKVTDSENGLAREVAEGLKLAGLGGSDAHDAASVGIYATAFNDKIDSEADLVAALRRGDCQAVRFR